MKSLSLAKPLIKLKIKPEKKNQAWKEESKQTTKKRPWFVLEISSARLIMSRSWMRREMSWSKGRRHYLINLESVDGEWCEMTGSVEVHDLRDYRSLSDIFQDKHVPRTEGEGHLMDGIQALVWLRMKIGFEVQEQRGWIVGVLRRGVGSEEWDPVF